MKDEPNTVKNSDNVKKKQPKEYKSNFLSRLFLCWMCPVFISGNKRDLEEEDLIKTSKKYYSDKLGDKLEK